MLRSFVFASILTFSFCQTLYEVLGVNVEAEQRDIKKAYYQLALTLHPDKMRNPTEEDKTKYMNVVKAYETLSDPEKRRAYDVSGNDSGPAINAVKQYTDQPFSFKAFSSGFRFEAIYTPHHLSKAPSITIVLLVTVDLLFIGINQRSVQFSRTSLCRSCNATGAASHSYAHKCDICKGTGLRDYVILSNSTYSGMSYRTTCNICKGSGFCLTDDIHRCNICHGQGSYVIRDSVIVHITGGIRDGYEIVFRGQGNEQFLRRQGDLIVRLEVIPISLFEIDGYDIKTNITITVIEAILGFERSLKLPSNETVVIKNSLKCADGSILTVVEKGIPIGKSGLYGSLFAKIHVIYPILLSCDEIHKLKLMLKGNISDVLEYILYQSHVQLDAISNNTNYAFSAEEAFYSSECKSVENTCTINLFNMIQFWLNFYFV